MFDCLPPMDRSMPGSLYFTVSQSLFKLMSFESVMSSNHLILCHPLYLLSSIFPSIGVFSNESAFPTKELQSIGALASASVLPMNIQGWFSLGWTGWISLQSKGVLRVFSSTTVKASILQHWAFFVVQLTYLYMTTWKNIGLTIWAFVGNVLSLLFNMMSRFVIAFLPRSKRLLISWLQSPSAVIFEPPKTKSATVSIVSPSICHEVMGRDAMILVFWMLF